jgi:hypothetical protein
VIGSEPGCGTGAAVDDGGGGTTEPESEREGSADGGEEAAGAGPGPCTPAEADDPDTGAPAEDRPARSLSAEDAAGPSVAVGEPWSVAAGTWSTPGGWTVPVGTVPGSAAPSAGVLPLPGPGVAGGAPSRSTGGSSDADEGAAEAPSPLPRVASSAVAAASPTNTTAATKARSTRSRRVPTSGGRNVRHGQRPHPWAPGRG